MLKNLENKVQRHNLKFENEECHSSYLINFWESMFTYTILIALGAIFDLLEFFALRSSKRILILVLQRLRVLTH